MIGNTNRHLAQAIGQARILMQVSVLQTQVATLTEHIATVTQIVQALADAPAPVAINPTGSPDSDDEGDWSASPQLLVRFHIHGLDLYGNTDPVISTRT